jgi:hypothetical protein
MGGTVTDQRSYKHKDFGLVRLQSVLILALLGCVLPAHAQTLNSSRADNSGPSPDTSGILSSKHGSTSFGAVDAGFSDAVGEGVQSYNAAVGADNGSEFTDGLSGSGVGRKSLASIKQLLASGSVPSTKAQGMKFHGARGSGEFTQKEIATPALTGVATRSLNASIVFSKMIESGSSSDTEEQYPAPESAAIESGTSFERVATSQNGLERISDPLTTSQGMSFESLCAEGCSRNGYFSITEGRRNIIESHEQALAHHLSRSAERLSFSNSATGENSGKYFGRIAAQESKVLRGSLIDAKSIGPGSNDQR